MSIRPFKSNKELVKFARAFLRNRLETFNKDVAICLTPNARGEHAYFPALMICIAFADLMSGLYAGTLRTRGSKELKRYARKFMKDEYTSDRRRLDLLYEGLRHKIAHLAYPYPVFDTVTARSKTFKGQRRRRVTWDVHASKPGLAIEVDDSKAGYLPKVSYNPPWDVSYNCLITVSVLSFKTDIVSSISEYLRNLQSSRNAREHFAKCMFDDYFRPANHPFAKEVGKLSKIRRYPARLNRGSVRR
jgi:hypothetical protein